MKKNLPVSKKVYKDFNERISLSIASLPASASEAKRIFDAYLNGSEPTSNDGVAIIAFTMIKPEIDRAKERSYKARIRAQKAKEAKKVAAMTEEEKEAEMIRKLSATRYSLHENKDEIRRLLFHQTRREYEELKKKLWIKAKAEQKKHRLERPYFNPPVFSDFTHKYIYNRLEEIKYSLRG